MDILHLKLSERKAKAVAKLLSNDTATSIMDFIREKSHSESQIAKKLGIPLSTVHHNIKKLKDVGLVKSDEFTYSEKGKEVRHYKLASDQVIISTNPLASVPSVASGVGVSLAVALLFVINKAMKKVQPKATAMVEESAAEGAMMADSARIAMETTYQADPVVWPYILLGAGVMLAGILIAAYIQRLRS